MSFKVELPEIINMEDGIAPFVHIFTKEGKELSYIKSLNTKTLIATCYKLEKDSRGLLRVSNDGSDILTEDIQLEDVTIKIK